MTPNEGFFLYQLRTYKENGVIASLFIDPKNPDDFVAGYVEAVTPRQVLLQSISPFGRFDGFMVVRLCDIFMILGEDDYTVRLSRLLSARGEQRTSAFPVAESEDLIHAMCRNAMAANSMVTLWLHDDVEHIGRIVALDDMRVTVAEVDYFGLDPRPSTYALRDVEMASCGSEDDLMYQLLADQPLSVV